MYGYVKFETISGFYRLRVFPALLQSHAQNSKGHTRCWHTLLRPYR